MDVITHLRLLKYSILPICLNLDHFLFLIHGRSNRSDSLTAIYIVFIKIVF